MWYILIFVAHHITSERIKMDKYENIHKIVNEIGIIIFKYKDKDVTQDAECKEAYSKLQKMCDKYRNELGEQEGLLAVKLSDLFLKYLCGADLGGE